MTKLAVTVTADYARQRADSETAFYQRYELLKESIFTSSATGEYEIDVYFEFFETSRQRLINKLIEEGFKVEKINDLQIKITWY